jgi:uncharacterized membrane protein
MEHRAARLVDRWRAAGVIDDATVQRIRAWESQHGSPDASRFGRFAFGFGGLLLGAGVLLFVAANWQWLSPWGRFALLAVTISVLHAGGGITAARSPALATTLHAVGTAALGGGIFLAGQVFNLAEHWPAGFLLWAAGAAAALWLLRDWPQAVWLAILAPAWLIGEWLASDLAHSQRPGTLLGGMFVLAVAYTAAVTPAHGAAWRRAIALLGALVLVPVGVLLPFEPGLRPSFDATGGSLAVAAGAMAIVLPLLVGFWLRGRGAWPLLLAAAFVLAIVQLDRGHQGQVILIHLLYAASAAALVWWGVHERHRLRINLGVLVFALNVLAFYYGSVLDRLDRALGLIGLGMLFIVGGWLLEHARRRLVDRLGTHP